MSSGALATLGVAEPGTRVLMAGQPRTQRPQHDGPAEAHHPKELLLGLARAGLRAAGAEVTEGNPHFLPIAEWLPTMTVLHGAPLDLACPVPVVRNAMFLDGEDLLALAEERVAGDPHGLRQRRLALMDRVFALVPERAWDKLPPRVLSVLEPAPVAALLGHAAALARPDGGAAGGLPPRPVRWLPCDVETGPYNFLGLRRDRPPGSSQVAVQFEAAAARGGGGPVLVAFATPGTLGDLGPALRAFRALAEEGGRAMLFVFFFGSPEEFAASVAARSHALFFGDNFRSPRIRFLFAPFEAGEALEALRRATGSIDSAYGGVLDALARGLGLRHRLLLGPDGRFDLAGGASAGGPAEGHAIAWGELYAPATLARRRQAANRAAERALVGALAAMA
jgi:hypothetical protein